VKRLITDPAEMRHELAKIAEDTWRLEKGNRLAVEGALMSYWLENGLKVEPGNGNGTIQRDASGLVLPDIRQVALEVVKSLNTGQDISKLKGERYPKHWRPSLLHEIAARQDEDLKWIISDLLLAEAGHLLSAWPHAGKSLAWLIASIQAVLQRKVWGRFVVSSSVHRILYLESEDPRILVENRIRDLLRAYKLKPEELKEAGFYLGMTGPFDLVKMREQVLGLIDEVKPDFLVLSTLQGLLGGRSWNDQDAMADVNAFLVELGRTVPNVVLTHSPQNGKARRAGGTITQDANFAITSHFKKNGRITSGKNQGKETVNVRVNSKMWAVPEFDLLIDSEAAPTPEYPERRRLLDVRVYEEAELDRRQAEKKKRETAVAFLKDNPKLKAKDAARALGCSTSYVYNVRQELKAEEVFAGGSAEGAGDHDDQDD
jgi:AAA domain